MDKQGKLLWGKLLQLVMMQKGGWEVEDWPMVGKLLTLEQKALASIGYRTAPDGPFLLLPNQSLNNRIVGASASRYGFGFETTRSVAVGGACLAYTGAPAFPSFLDGETIYPSKAPGGGYSISQSRLA
ncbi:hypothetical protein SUGI_1506780 [Cryptomeria japonica]|uniref:Uncharacterized protein n=1 Tax=Cryptomeria japonica TaxID=3369 RepID=A0AAD3RRL5_CRYJA|nr:hypothetical protein SUGI_1503610 [Cryptomeria japonica]GLJ59382.1 hypothetical protein SUGI_1506780 [Cryptomeria japonica]